jgi:ureidoglycolate hydrolase
MRTMPDSVSIRLETPLPTPETFAPFGELILPSAYGKHFGPDDAQLDLSDGQPRLYIMRSPFHGTTFNRMTRHVRVTQCLGARDSRDWFIALAPADPARSEPDSDAIRAFSIPGDTAIKLHRGTWHAGPFFTWEWIDFYNLEMVDTNQVDSESFDFGSKYGRTYVLGPND